MFGILITPFKYTIMLEEMPLEFNVIESQNDFRIVEVQLMPVYTLFMAVQFERGALVIVKLTGGELTVNSLGKYYHSNNFS